jgi:hypothetical protein
MELDQQVQSLRAELLELPIGPVEPVLSVGHVAGTKSGTVAVAGTLSVAGVTSLVLRGVVDVLKSWMDRNKARHIHISVGDTTIDLTAPGVRTERDMVRLLEQLSPSDADTDE